MTDIVTDKIFSRQNAACVFLLTSFYFYLFIFNKTFCQFTCCRAERTSPVVPPLQIWCEQPPRHRGFLTLKNVRIGSLSKYDLDFTFCQHTPFSNGLDALMIGRF